MGAGLLLGRIIQQQFHAEEEKIACIEMFLVFFARWALGDGSFVCVFVENAVES